MPSHYIPTDLRNPSGALWGVESRARLATTDATDCLLFVHGFGGGATSTWVDFPQLLPALNSASGFDLLFFGYASLFRTPNANARSFLDLLEALHTVAAAEVVNPSLPVGAAPRKASFRYRQVTVVAHSLGAVITRRALLDAARDTRPPAWLARTRLIYFAPAHKGANVIRLTSTALRGLSTPVGTAMEVFLKSHIRVLQHLEEGSPYLAALEADTIADIDNRGARHLIAHVAHAERDQIVVDSAFGRDRPVRDVPGHGHISVCKPTADYRLPMELVLQWMRAS